MFSRCLLHRDQLQARGRARMKFNGQMVAFFFAPPSVPGCMVEGRSAPQKKKKKLPSVRCVSVRAFLYLWLVSIIWEIVTMLKIPEHPAMQCSSKRFRLHSPVVQGIPYQSPSWSPGASRYSCLETVRDRKCCSDSNPPLFRLSNSSSLPPMSL